MFTTAGTLESLSPICPCTISGWWSTHCWAAVCCPFVAALPVDTGGTDHRAEQGVKDACTGDIQEQDWEPLNRGIVLKRWKTVLAALAIFCLLTGCGMMNHGDAESESPSPLEGPAATGRIHAGSRLHLGRPVPSL